MRPQSDGGLPIHRRNTLLPQRQREARPDRDRPRDVERPIRRAPDGGVIITRPDGVTIRRPAEGGVAIRRPTRDGGVVDFRSGGFSGRTVFTGPDGTLVVSVGNGFQALQPHFGIPGRRHRHHHHHDHGVCHVTFPLGYYNWWDDNYTPPLIYAGYADPYVTTGQTYAQQMAAQQAAEEAAQLAQPPTLTELEQADLALALGEPEEAVRRYQQYASDHDESADVVRSLGLALFEAGRIDEAFATMALAYEQDPTLASRPVAASALEGGEAKMLDRVRLAVRHAHKLKTGSAWLTVAVLMQAQERDRVALTMAERARDAGLAEPIYDQFRSALGG